MSDDHSKLVPLLPISNRTVKRLRANDSVHPHVKVGHRQTPYKVKSPTSCWAFCFCAITSPVTTRRVAACCGGHSRTRRVNLRSKLCGSQSRSFLFDKLRKGFNKLRTTAPRKLLQGAAHTGQDGSFDSFILRGCIVSASTSSNFPHSVESIPSSSFNASAACMLPMMPTNGAKIPSTAQRVSSLSICSG